MIKFGSKRRLAFVVSLVAVSVGPLRATPSAAALEYGADTVSVSRALTLVNQERAEVGCSSLRVVSGLQRPAQRQSEDQAARDGFGHNGADGSTVDTRLSGLGYSRWGENVVQAQSARAAVRFWSHSPRHRANMLNCAFTQTGLAMARSDSGKRYWTQTFGG